MAREGLGETQPRTDRVASDRRPRRTNDHAGGGEQATGSPGPDRQRPPLPTRVDSLPDLPAAYDDALDAGLAALSLALDADAREAIATHARLLLAWNAAINLTAITDPAAIALAHVLDSLSAVPLLAARFGGRAFRLADLGSGGGYPGLPLAAALPGARVWLVDSTAKKARFLEGAATAARLRTDDPVPDRVVVRASRAEALAADVAAGRERRFDIVTARAVAALPDLVELSFPILGSGGLLVAWKRGDIAAELAASRRAVAALGGGSIEVRPVTVPGLDGHRLVLVTSAGRTPPGYPRDPGRRARNRW